MIEPCKSSDTMRMQIPTSMLQNCAYKVGSPRLTVCANRLVDRRIRPDTAAIAGTLASIAGVEGLAGVEKID